LGTKKLSSWKKAMYGAGDIVGTLIFTVIPLFLSYYFTDILGMTPILAGLVILLGNAWDAVSDPMAGRLSDRTKSRFGRRRPYFLYLTVPLGVAFVLLFSVPSNLSMFWTFIYCTFAFMLVILTTTFYQVPYLTYGMEIEKGYDGRTSLTAWRMLFSVLFGLVGAVVPKMIWESAVLPSVGFRNMALVFALPIMIAPLFPFFAGNEPPAPVYVKQRYRDNMRDALKSDAFIRAVLIYVLSWGAINIVITLMIYYFKHVLNMSAQFEIIIGVLFGVTILALPIWVKISEKLDKRKAYMIGVTIFSFFLLPLLLPSDTVKTLVWWIIPPLGIGLSAIHVMPNTLLPEAIETVTKGNSSEGVYYGILTFFFKTVNAVFQFVILGILGWTGYIESTQDIAVSQPASALLAIRVLVSLVPVFLMIGGLIISIRFPIGRDQAQHE